MYRLNYWTLHLPGSKSTKVNAERGMFLKNIILARFESISSVRIVFIRTALKFESHRVVELGDDLCYVVPPPRTWLGGVGVIYSVIEYPLFEVVAVCTFLKATPEKRNARSRPQPLRRCLCSVVVSLSGSVCSGLFLFCPLLPFFSLLLLSLLFGCFILHFTFLSLSQSLSLSCFCFHHYPLPHVHFLYPRRSLPLNIPVN